LRGSEIIFSAIKIK